MVRNGGIKMGMDLVTTTKVMSPTSVQQKKVLPTKAQSISVVPISTEMAGLTTSLTSFPMIQRNGLILMETVTVTTGAILNGTKAVKRIGQVNTSKVRIEVTNVQTRHRRMSTRMVVPRVSETPTKTA